MKDKKIDIQIEGQLDSKVESQNPTSNHIENQKSGGNTPSDLGAIKNNKTPSSASNSASRSNLQRPNIPETGGTPSTSQSVQSGNRQTNVGANRVRTKEKNTKKNIENKNQQNKAKFANDSKLNPVLNQNKMKNFGKKNKVQDPKTNPSASFFDKAKGMFNGKMPFSNPGGIVSRFSRNKTKQSKSVTNKLIEKKADFNIFAIFQALPIQVKVVIISGIFGLFLLIILLIIIVVNENSSLDGNRELMENYIQGDYTEEELCEYLDRNGYISLENSSEECKDSPEYKFFVTMKQIIQEYEEKYSRYRFKVNVELLYETLAYFRADDEFYEKVTEQEIRDLVEAMLEEIEETCVVKSYDKKKKICTKTKYVYTLYEFSLNKYISYLKYGTTSTHPNYGNDTTNKSSNGKAVTRKCGEGKNTDYIFGFGLVNTSSSPLSEFSNCPNDPVTEEDYEKLPITRTTLEKLGAWGSVPTYDHVYTEDTKIEITENGQPDSATTKNVVISPSHQTGNMYSDGTLSEKTSMYRLAAQLKSELESRGYNVFVVSENDGTSKYSSSHTQAGVDWLNGATGVYIALHSNATGTSSKGWGPLALYDATSSSSKKFTSIVCKHMENLYGAEGRQSNQTCNTDNGSRSEVPNFYKFGGKGGATLVEVGFHDNPNEAAWIKNSYGKIANSLANAIDEYVGS